jgi:predicted hydrocarbon binding protein
MSQSLDLTSHGMLALSRASLTTLRSALLRDGGPAAAVYLQEAGYAGGDAMWDAFSRWLAERTDIAPDALDVDAFEARATEFFCDAGWGTLQIGTLGDSVATLDSPDWGEAEPSSALEHPGCHLTTGMFADLFGRVAGSPVAVLEVECRSTGAERCRFLVANPEFLEQVYDEMSSGTRYDEAITTVTSLVG